MITLDAHYDANMRMFILTLWNGGEDISRPILNYTSQFYPVRDLRVEGAALTHRDGNTIWLSKPETFRRNMFWRIEIGPLAHEPKNMSQGIKEAVIWAEDVAHPVISSTLTFHDETFASSDTNLPNPIKPKVGILPWPQSISIDETTGFRGIYFAGESYEDLRAVGIVQALYRRLFPAMPSVFSNAKSAHRLYLEIDNSLSSSAYRLNFHAGNVRLHYSDEAGRHYALVTLSQMAHFARFGFQWIENGIIEDQPRFSWRGVHLDVARHFFTSSSVKKLLDIAAWCKFNQFHWHLTDDEGWRLPSERYPTLNEIASWRGPQTALNAQYSHLSARYGGYYSKAEIGEIIDHAAALQISIMPEIDLPGHSKALLAALPSLIETNETPESYASVQGYMNNALNPANQAVYPVLREIIEEAAALFPSKYFHIGGDEVSDGAWHGSPLAKGMHKGAPETLTRELQNTFTKSVADIVEDCGKTVAAWDECGEGDALMGRSSLLFAWRETETVNQLLEKGFDVIATPGQAYYLDMTNTNAQQGCGATWAGTSSLETCYHYETPDDSQYNGTLHGVQAGIWSESMPDEGSFSALVFPRLFAIAERAWTSNTQSDFQRFLSLIDYLPQSLNPSRQNIATTNKEV